MRSDLVCPVCHAVDLYVAAVNRSSNFSTCVGATEFVGEVEARYARFAAASKILYTPLYVVSDR